MYDCEGFAFTVPYALKCISSDNRECVRGVAEYSGDCT